MERKGVGSVVAYIILVLISIIAIGIFLGAYFNNINKGTSDDSASCLGIDLKASKCNIISVAALNGLGLPDSNPAVVLHVERLPGGAGIRDLKLVITDDAGSIHVENPIDITLGPYSATTNYSTFNEYSSIDAVARDIDYNIVSATVSAVVGDSETICNPTRQAIVCSNF